MSSNIDNFNEINNYTVNRSWNLNNKYIKDKVSVKKNGSEDSFLTQNWTMFVESILPSALANFYFFDGEKIAELAQGETSVQMKDSIKALLGINIIDLLENDLTRIIKRMDNEKSEDYDCVHVEDLRHIKEEKEDALKHIDDEISKIEKKLSRVNKKLDKKTEEFNAKGGKIASQSQELYSERISLNSDVSRIQENYYDFAAGELPLLMVRDLLSAILQKSSVERENKSISLAVRKIDQMFQMYSVNGNVSTKDIKEFIKFLKDQAKQSEIKCIFDLS